MAVENWPPATAAQSKNPAANHKRSGPSLAVWAAAAGRRKALVSPGSSWFAAAGVLADQIDAVWLSNSADRLAARQLLAEASNFRTQFLQGRSIDRCHAS